MDLVLIRHPRVAVASGVCYGQTDVPLLGDAAESARSIEARLRALDVPSCNEGWHSSPLRRCSSLAQALSGDARVHIDARLSEMNFGAWENCAWDSIDRALIDAWAADIEHARPHGGESLVQFSERVLSWLNERSRTAHVIAHAGVIRLFAAHLLKLDRATVLQWPIDFGGIAQFRRVRDEWLLVRWNA
jgi:alpha-ribazole phosphatase